jgi:hypothetical protein
MPLNPTWYNYFDSRTTNNVGNKNTQVFSSAWATNIPNATKLTAITNDPTTAPLAMDINHQIVVLHSFKNLGGTVFNPTNKFACLLGTRQVTLAVIFDKALLLAICNKATPGYKTIIICLDKAEIEGLAHPPKAPTHLQCPASFFPPPGSTTPSSPQSCPNQPLQSSQLPTLPPNLTTNTRTTPITSQAAMNSSLPLSRC